MPNQDTTKSFYKANPQDWLSLQEVFRSFVDSIKKSNKYTQWGEDSIIEAIFEKVGTENKWCCECGAGDGIFMSNTRALIEKGWSALLIESESEKYDTLCRNSQDYCTGEKKSYPGQIVHTLQEHVGPGDFDRLLAPRYVPKNIDLLVCDIDGQDYWAINGMLEYRPRVLMVEFDPDAPLDFIPPVGGPGQAGLHAILSLGIAKLYAPVVATYNNAIFIEQRLIGRLLGMATPDYPTPQQIQEFLNQPKPVSESVAMVLKCQHGKIRNRHGVRAFAGRIGHCQCCGSSFGTLSSRQKYCQDCNPYALTMKETFKLKNIVVNDSTDAETPPVSGLESPQELSEVPPLTSVVDDEPKIERWQVYAAKKWQDWADGVTIEVESEEEAELWKAGKLPVRKLEAENRKITIAIALSTPRIGFLDSSDALADVATFFQAPRIRGYGISWWIGVTRAIQKALDWVDHEGNGPDFILTGDYDTYPDIEHVKQLAIGLAGHPEFDCIVPMQVKRGVENEILCTLVPNQDFTKEFLKIKTGHFGLTLFRRDFFEKLDKPWFQNLPDKNGEWEGEHTDADIYFWNRAYEKGLNTVLATKIVVGHGEEVISYPRLIRGKVFKWYQPVNEWLNGNKMPSNVGVIPNDVALQCKQCEYLTNLETEKHFLVTHEVQEGDNRAGGAVLRLAIVENLGQIHEYLTIKRVQEIYLGKEVDPKVIFDARNAAHRERQRKQQEERVEGLQKELEKAQKLLLEVQNKEKAQ
jgi:hypothetical protein